MKLTIISPTSRSEKQIAWLEINTPDGNFVVQPHHSPTAFLLEPQKEFVYRLVTGKQEALMLKQGGILHVTRTNLKLLLSE